MPVTDLSYFLPSKKLKLIDAKRGQGGTIWIVTTIPSKAEPCRRCQTICTQFYGKTKTRLRDEPLRSGG